MWPPLVEGLGAPHPEAGEWQKALPRRIAGLDFEASLREMRRYQAEEILRIGLHDVSGNLESENVSHQLGLLAESCLGQAVELVAATLGARYGFPEAELAVLGLGSFGAREMRYGSDLDLVFLYSDTGTTPGGRDPGIDHQEWFARLAQRVIGALEARLDEGRLYEVDTRLRPSGQQGMLVTSYGAFDQYHDESAAPWERVALLRARTVYASRFAAARSIAERPGAGALPPVHCEGFDRRLAAITYDRPLPEDTLRAELLRMRQRMEVERQSPRGSSGHPVHLRFSAGGLTDLDFLAAWFQLRHGADDPPLRTTNPLEALERLSATGRLPDGDGALLSDYRFLQRASQRLRLLGDCSDDWLGSADRPRLARALDMPETRLGDELRVRMGRIRSAFSRLLGKSS
jgi:glutamate-ammonia-ligase adenylyltransferase